MKEEATTEVMESSETAAAAVIDDGAGKYGLGRHGAHEIRRQLARGNPMAVIKEFQAGNSLAVPNADKVLRFLDLLSIKRAHAYQTIHQKLYRRILDTRIPKSTSEQKQKLLQASFRYIDIDELRDIPVRLLSELEEIPECYLTALAAQPALLERLPLCIVCQVWCKHPQLYHSKLVNLLAEFVGDPTRLAVYGSLSGPKLPPRERRQSDRILQLLVQWIGGSSLLYDFAVRTIRDQFASTHQHGYCILRMELLMTLHDQGQQELAQKDPVHMFAWCLDAAVREGELEGRLLDELRARYTQLKERDKARDREREEAAAPDMDAERSLKMLLQDIAMVVAHPLVTSVLLRSVSARLDKVIAGEQVPKDNDGLRLLSHVLLLGCSSRRLLRPKRHAKLPKSPAIVLRSFYPLLCILRVLHQSPPHSHSYTEEQRASVRSRLQQLFAQDRVGVCRCVFAIEVHDRVRRHQFGSCGELLSILASLEGSSYWEPAPLSVLEVLATNLCSLLATDDAVRAAATVSPSANSAFGYAILEQSLAVLGRRSRVYSLHVLQLVLQLCSSEPALAVSRAVGLVTTVYNEGIHRPLHKADSAIAARDAQLQAEMDAAYTQLTALPGEYGQALGKIRQKQQNGEAMDVERQAAAPEAQPDEDEADEDEESASEANTPNTAPTSDNENMDDDDDADSVRTQSPDPS